MDNCIPVSAIVTVTSLCPAPQQCRYQATHGGGESGDDTKIVLSGPRNCKGLSFSRYDDHCPRLTVIFADQS
jgi:hypothetical protein